MDVKDDPASSATATTIAPSSPLRRAEADVRGAPPSPFPFPSAFPMVDPLLPFRRSEAGGVAPTSSAPRPAPRPPRRVSSSPDETPIRAIIPSSRRRMRAATTSSERRSTTMIVVDGIRARRGSAPPLLRCEALRFFSYRLLLLLLQLPSSSIGRRSSRSRSSSGRRRCSGDDADAPAPRPPASSPSSRK